MRLTNSIFVLFVVFGLSSAQQNYRPAPYPYQYGYNQQQGPSIRQSPYRSYPSYGGYASPCRNPCASQGLSRALLRPQNFQQPYINYAQSSQNSRYSSDPYANVPVEIIDVDETGQRIIVNYNTNFKTGTNTNPYANVPIEIVDVDIYGKPISPSSSNVVPSQSRSPVIRSSSHSDYTVSGGQFVSNSSSVGKPVVAVINRSFNPEVIQPSYNLTFVNGQQLTENEATIQPENTSTEAVTTEEPEEEVNEEPNETNSWFNRK